MDRAEEYERHAQEAEAKAASAPDAQSRQQFKDLAINWRKLARQARGIWARPPEERS
jgi:hypothetical protein